MNIKDKNKIKVTSDNIFPIIKRFLYSDNEIFLRELISNAVDAIMKLKTIINLKNIDDIKDDFKIQIILDNNNMNMHIIDNGIGMTQHEIEKYINQIAFSGAEEFINKYQNQSHSIIGHFGLGFYSSFMISKKVTILTQSYKNNFSSISWSCEGTPDFIMKKIEKINRGTEIILNINDENKEFLDYQRIFKLLKKYCNFIPIPIFLSDKKNNNNKSNYINNPFPIWTKKSSDLKDKDYIKFHKELYPYQLGDPLFWIHLSIDHPFHLTGILFFPKIENKLDVQRDKIHLYQNQIFVTDNLESIVPDFLSLLRGVIDSPDIPLNVSRSHLQSDRSVKSISRYITRKVSDKFNNMFQNERDSFQKKWEDIKIIVEYGMVSDENFFQRAIKFFLFYTIKKEFFTLEEFKNKVENNQVNKEGKIVFIYSSDIDLQYSSIKIASDRGYEILLLNSPISVHLIQKLEFYNKNICFIRVDADHVDNVIHKPLRNKNIVFEISDEDKKKLKYYINSVELVDKYNLSIKLENFDSQDNPFSIVIPEFSRRIKDASYSLNKMFKEKNKYDLLININHVLIRKILTEVSEASRKKLIENAIILALLSKNLLYGKLLDSFISDKINQLIL